MSKEKALSKRETRKIAKQSSKNNIKTAKRLKKTTKARRAPRRSLLRTLINSKNSAFDSLLNAESALGRTIFGPVPPGCQREFFSYRKNVWIWYESFQNPLGMTQEMIIRYEVRPDGVYKRPGDGNYQKIEGIELENFRQIARIYLDLIKTKLYY